MRIGRRHTGIDTFFSSCLMGNPVATTAGAVLIAALFVSEPAQATVSEFLRSQTAVQGRAIVDAARAMPADKYGDALATDPMTFGAFVLHVAAGNYLFCSHIGGAPQPTLSEVTASAPKDALVKRLQDSFQFCADAVASLNDAKMAEVLDIGVVKTPRSMAILTLTGTWNTHLTMAHDYLSQNGQKIPSPAP
jgi:hypothetical protein